MTYSTFTPLGEAAQRVVDRIAAPPGVETWPVTDRASWLARRQQDVTASAAAALLGVHEYMTCYELWALKSGLVTEDPEETPPIVRGRLLEPVVVNLIAERHQTWKPHRPESYYRDPAVRIGATPDLFVTDPLRKGFGVVQIKTVEPGVFRKKWRDEDGVSISPPLWIVVQALIEAKLTGASWAMVAAMRVGFGLDLDLIEVPLHDGLFDRIKTETEAFWGAVWSGQPPAADYARDGDTIALLNPVKPDLPPIDLSADNFLPALVSEREELMARASADKKRKAAIDAEITDKLAGHGVGLLADGRRVIRTMRHVKEHVRKASDFPVISIKGQAT